MANSVIFVLSGIIIMEKAILAEGEGAVQGADWGWLIVVYLFILVIRFASFGVFRCAPANCVRVHGMPCWSGREGVVWSRQHVP